MSFEKGRYTRDAEAAQDENKTQGLNVLHFQCQQSLPGEERLGSLHVLS